MRNKKMLIALVSLMAACSIAVPLALAYDVPSATTSETASAANSPQPSANKDTAASSADDQAACPRGDKNSPDGKAGKGNRGGKGGGESQGKPPAKRSERPAAGSSTASVTSVTDKNGYTITISGGYDTDPVDNGRPVVLIASALGVAPEVFRDAFSGVNPARGSGPTTEQEQANKAVLLEALSSYGITNDRLDEVSNYYRYMASKGEVWTRTPAALTTAVKDGQVTGIEITDAGSGYSSAPTVTITGPKGEKLTAKTTVSYGTDLQTNGSLSSVSLDK